MSVSPLSLELRRRVLVFIMEHPGCVHCDAEHEHYGEPFRRFILDLYGAVQDLDDVDPAIDLDDFADTIMVPLGTLKEWLDQEADTGMTSLAPASERAPQRG
jgi:hypothetical protein